MCAALRPLQACPLSRGKFRFPSRAIPCPKSLPLQARLGLLFLFLPFFCPFVLPPAWRGWLSLIQVRRCSGFAHSWVTLAQQGLSGVSLVSFLYPVLKLAKNRRTGASLDFLPRTSLPLPLKGEGPGIVCLGFVGFAPLGHSCLTRLQQGRFGGWLVFAPYSASKTAHRATQALVWFSPLFPGALWVWQSYQIPLQLVFHCFLDGSDRVTQIPVPHQACLCFYLRRFRINESLLFKLPNVLGNRVSAHSCVLADPSNAGPALVGFPVLAEHQVGIDGQLAWGQSQREDLIGQKKKSSQWAAVGVSVLKFRGVTSPVVFQDFTPMLPAMSIEKSKFTARSQVYSCKRSPNFLWRSPILCFLRRNF